MKVYVVVVDARPSTEGYSSLEKAREFIESRSDKPKLYVLPNGAETWSYISETNTYYIREITIK